MNNKVKEYIIFIISELVDYTYTHPNAFFVSVLIKNDVKRFNGTKCGQLTLMFTTVHF
jgi:hypothetical protein